MTSRQLIFRILTEFDKHPGNLDRIIDHGLRGAQIDHRDRRFVFEIVYGVIRWQLTLDNMIDHYLTGHTDSKDMALYRMLRIGIYQLLYMRIPDHASVNETVRLAKSNNQTARYASVVNAIMRNIIKNKGSVSLPEPDKDLAGRLSIEFSHPRWMIERWMKNYGLSNTKKLLKFNNEKPSIYLRRKLRDLSKPQFEADVRTICEQASGYLNLYYKLKKSLLPENIRMIQQGVCNVQAPSSGWVTAMMDVNKGDHILDLCAAPGGKTALMSELASDTGTVVACELKWGRMKSVIEMVKRMRLRNVYALLCDGVFPPFTGYFDKVLLDVPCSGTGVLHRHPEARLIRTPQDIERLTNIQRKLLDSSVNLVGKGGIIVYSTCSIEPEENDLIIQSFLNDHKEFVIDNNPDVIPDRFISNAGFLQITPFEHAMDGMFAARLRKIR